MPAIRYKDYNPTRRSKLLIAQCVGILEDYRTQGYSLTLRQLYYQLVSRDVIPNNVKSYNRLGSIITDAREGGYIDWNHIVDRSRSVRAYSHHESVGQYLKSVAYGYSLDYWKGQPRRVYVFVEKEALEQIVGKVSAKFDVPYFANKGYLSASSAWKVAHNMMLHSDDGTREFTVLHLGDHDPSGIDMTRDIQERLNLFSTSYDDKPRVRVKVKRIALNLDQIDEYAPPPNPAKVTDSRYEGYAAEFGESSWELDALEPKVIDSLIEQHILAELEDEELFESQKMLQRSGVERLLAIADDFNNNR